MFFDTPYKKKLIEKFKDKNVSQNSTNVYVRNMEKLNNDEPLKNLNFLQDVDNIIKKLENYKENTKRSYLISICSALSTDQTTKAKKELYQKYYKLMIAKNKELKEVEAKNEKSDTQLKNWIKWDEVKDKLNELKERVDKFKDLKVINEHNYNTLLSYMILSLYVDKPPRRNMDYQKMMVVKKQDDTLPIDENYLVLDDKKFIFNVFKTVKTEGEQIEDIPDKLFKVIELYLKFNPLNKGKKSKDKKGFAFLVYYNGSRLADSINSITRILNKTFGKSIGSSMLRHIFLTDKYGDLVIEQKKDADAMGHSLSQAQDYVKKD